MILPRATALLVLTTCTMTSTVLADEVPAWAQGMLDEWYDAYNERDSERLGAMHSDDARVGDAVGPDQIAARFEAGWAEDNDTCTGSFTGFRVVGGIAAGWGEDTCTSRDEPGEVSRVEWISVYERYPGGRWLTIRDYGQPAMQ